MRFTLLLGSILTLINGFQLFVLSRQTDDAFAWTLRARKTT
jgi:hypothetical protein